MPAIIALAIAAKAGCLLAGSLIHEVAKFVNSHGADHKDTARGPCLLIKDQQLGQDTPKESPSNALILYGSREVVASSSSRALVTLPNESSALESQVDMTDSNHFSVMMMNSLDFFADCPWFYLFLARFIALFHALVKSALRSVVSDMKMSFALFSGSVSENAVQKNQVASIAFLIQVYFTSFIAKVFVIFDEAARLLKSRTEKNVSTLLGQLFPVGGERRCPALLTDDSISVGDSSSVHISTLTQTCIALVITFFKQALAMFFETSTSLLGRLPRHHSTKVMSFVLLLCASISLIGWSVPVMVFDGNKLDLCRLKQPAVEVEAGPFSSITPPLMSSLLVDTSNSHNLMEPIDSFNDVSSVSMKMGATDRLVDFPPSLYSSANEFSAASAPDFKQSGCIWIWKSVHFSNWNIDESQVIRSLPGFESTLESLPLINVLEWPSEDRTSNLVHASNETATEHSGGCIVSAATADAAFMTQSISQYPHQSPVELEIFPSSSTADGDASTKLMIIIVVGRPQELFNINYLLKLDGCSDSMQVNDRFSSMAVRMNEALTGLYLPALIAYDRGSFLYVWSENDFITVVLSESHTSFIWDRDAAAIIPLDGNIGAIHTVQSESSLFYALEDLSSVRYATSHLSADLDSPSLGLDHSLPSNTDTSSMQMITTELGPSQELPTIQNRQFGRSPTQNATIDPQLMLPAPSERTNSFEKIETSVLMNHSRRSSSPHSSLRFSTHKESHIFVELRQVALMLLMLAYHNSDNSDGTANEPDDVALSCGPVASLDTDLEIDEEFDAELISADGENEEDFVLPGDTNTIKSSRRELKALHSDLGSHWNSPSKRRMRRSPRTRSRPQYFQPT